MTAEQWREKARKLYDELPVIPCVDCVVDMPKGGITAGRERALRLIAAAIQAAVKQERERAIEIADGYVNNSHREAMAAAIRGQP